MIHDCKEYEVLTSNNIKILKSSSVKSILSLYTFVLKSIVNQFL